MPAPLILGSAIVALLALAAGAPRSSRSAPGVAGTPRPDAPPTTPQGPRLPMDGWRSISSRFGWRTHPVTHEEKHHNGIDLPAPAGTPVVAPEAGVVSRVDVAGVGAGVSRGNAVWLRGESGRLWGFLHLAAADVGPGVRVAQGQVLGRVGSTGQSTGNHLHLQVYASSGELVDPESVYPAGSFA